MQKKLSDEMITIKNAQRMLHVNKKALTKMIQSGQLLTEKNGRNIAISLKSIKEYLHGECNQIETNEKTVIVKNISSSELEMIAEWT